MKDKNLTMSQWASVLREAAEALGASPSLTDHFVEQLTGDSRDGKDEPAFTVEITDGVSCP